jgi:hypothetical protein
MELKLRKDIEETYIYNPFTNADVIGKFIPEGLYPHLYKLYPELFEVVEETKTKKTKVVNDILINNGTEEGGITE